MQLGTGISAPNRDDVQLADSSYSVVTKRKTTLPNFHQNQSYK